MNKYFDDKDDIRLINLIPHSIGMALMLLSRGTIVYTYAADFADLQLKIETKVAGKEIKLQHEASSNKN